jgi:hypothetical protein
VLISSDVDSVVPAELAQCGARILNLTVQAGEPSATRRTASANVRRSPTFSLSR